VTVASVIIVTFNSAGSIEPCLRAFRRQDDRQQWERIVVDNASRDQTVAAVQSADPDARLIQNPRNFGFAAAANRGVQAAAAASEILLLLNPDAVARPAALRELARALQSDDVVAAGGLLLRADSQPDRGFVVRRFPTVASMAAEILLLNRLWPRNPLNRRYRCLDLDYAQAQDVDQPAGACLAVKRRAFESIGGFDESFFPVWFEDVDFCRRLRAQGRIVYCPGAIFAHTGGHSVNKLPLADRQLFWYRNLLRYFRKHDTPSAVAVLRACIALGMALRSLAALVGFSPRDSGVREALRAYGGVISECVLPARSVAGASPR
jgi:N-acetylglucosaminyl-diphospho-decaprenol L-rhamnosyltransferase